MKLKEKAGQLVAATTLALALSVATSSAQAVIVTETIDFNNLSAGNFSNACVSVGNGDFCYNGASRAAHKGAARNTAALRLLLFHGVSP